MAANRRAFWLAAAALLVAGCDSQVTPAQKAAEDAKAVAMVEAAQRRQPPLQLVALQPIPASDLARLQFGGAGCKFREDDAQAAAPAFASSGQRAVIKTGGEAIVLAADSGSAAYPAGTFAEYSGKAQMLRLDKLPEAEDSDSRIPAVLTITDAYERVTYRAEGVLSCGG